MGRTKVGRLKTNPNTVLAFVRLPVELKECAGKWAHIWKLDDDVIVVKFSEREDTEELPSVHFGACGDIEERLRKLEDIVSRILNGEVEKIDCEKWEMNLNPCGGGDSNPRIPTELDPKSSAFVHSATSAISFQPLLFKYLALSKA